MKRPTTGQIITDLSTKTPDTQDPIELERLRHDEYNDHMMQAIATGKKRYQGDFFVVVITKMEKLLRIPRNYFFSRSSCPTPDYDQTVYKYHSAEDALEFIWVIPCKEACLFFKKNPLEIHPSQRDLLRFVLEFADGTLYKKAKELNNEDEKTPIAVLKLVQAE